MSKREGRQSQKLIMTSCGVLIIVTGCLHKGTEKLFNTNILFQLL